MYQLLVLLSLLASNAYGVAAITLDASYVNQYICNNQSYSVDIWEFNITDIDPEAFKGCTLLTKLYFNYNPLTKLDLEVFKYSSNLQLLKFMSSNKLTQFTNSKKITVPSLKSLIFYGTPLASLDSNLIQGLPNVTQFILNWNADLSPLKPNQLSTWKKLDFMDIRVKNQTSLTKDHFNGLNSLQTLKFWGSTIKTIEVHTLLALPNVTEIDFRGNELRSFEYLQIPEKLTTLSLSGNKINYFMLSRTMGYLRTLILDYNDFRSFKSMDFTFLANLTYLSLRNNPHAYPNEIAGHMKPLVNLNYISLSNLSINSIDSNFFKQNSKLYSIDLSMNKISVLPFNTFNQLKNLSNLIFSYNQISVLDNRTFVGLNNLTYLNLDSNLLTKIAPRTFYNLSSLFSLYLSKNLITEIDSSAFIGCLRLKFLYLNNNRLKNISPGTFSDLPLDGLGISYNQITEINKLIFEGMNNITYLDFSYNNISEIIPGTFDNVGISQSIYLIGNLLTKLENNTFAGLSQLSAIGLSNNKISRIEAGAFNGLTNLNYINLNSNNLTQLDESTFSGCKYLQTIYVSYNPYFSMSNFQRLCPTTSINCNVYKFY